MADMNEFERQNLLGIFRQALGDAKKANNFYWPITLSQADMLFIVSLIEKKPIRGDLLSHIKTLNSDNQQGSRN